MLDIALPLVTLAALVLAAVLGGRFIAADDARRRVGADAEAATGWLPGLRDRALLAEAGRELAREGSSSRD